MDELTRVTGDRFDEIIRKKFSSTKNPVFKHIGYVKSHEEANHLIQICDLLLGAIYNNHYPASGKNGKYKNEFSKYVMQKLGISSFKRDFWGSKKLSWKEKNFPKLHVSFWEIPYK